MVTHSREVVGAADRVLRRRARPARRAAGAVSRRRRMSAARPHRRSGTSRRHPWQLGLAVLGIALGVAVAVSIDLANESARRAFALATEAVTGRATHQIVGGPSGVRRCASTRDLRVRPGRARGGAGAGGRRRRARAPGRTLHLLGIDPFAEAPFRPYLGAETAERGRRPPRAIRSARWRRSSRGRARRSWRGRRRGTSGSRWATG